MSIPTDHARPLPDGVLYRCSATAGDFGGCHGATSTGLRVPDYADEGAEQVEQSLADLSEDMRATRRLWEETR